ncbi:MAG TPA: DEAD/DEAH box helicase family protein [Methylosinus sp.]|jgi:type I restriction enzyme R subunit|uniref:DEAD/DEAH box helicase family protein n=1 Tax=Methylosinus sp. TaxID=427 RepID=UPI002F943E82
MTSQFSFLAADFSEVHEHAAKAESLAHADPRAACFYSRFALEVIVKWLYRHDATLRDPYETTLSARIHEPTFQKLVGAALVAKARIVKDLGNSAVHDAKPVAFSQAVTALRELFHLSYWFVRSYGRAATPEAGIAFSADALPRTSSIPVSNLKQLQEVAKRFADAIAARDEAEKKRLASETERGKLETEIAALRAEVAKVKAVNAKTADTHDYNEEATRDAFIDLLLAEVGWSFTQPGRDTEYPVKGLPNNSGHGFVDYVLWGDDGKPLALVEAKRTKRDPRVGQQQAKLYADCLEAEFGQRPIIFYSNGYEHWLWDDQRYPPREVQGFLTKDELELAIRRRSILKQLNSVEMNADIVNRYYQTRAIRRVAEAFEKDHLRRALLVMATGAGKTRTVIALCDLLMRANWARRVLFLADRVALVNQAVSAFKKFLPAASPVNLVTEKDATGRAYVSTYPTMMRLIDEAKNGKRRFGSGHFDLIVIDEAHRSVYRKYGAVFDYFDSLVIGLTATPKDEVDRDTYRLFDLQRGVPTDAYGLDEAVKDGFLVPPRAVSVPLKFQREGIKYDDLSDDEKEMWDSLEWDEDGTVPTEVEPGAINKWLFNADTVDKVLEHLMINGLKVADGDRLGKTIVFAKNHEHAEFIVNRFDSNYPHLKGSFARVVDFKTEYAQSLIDDFSQPDKAPHIAVSVDMLDTGIDIPEVVNLVFFKIVRSKTKFWQMIGRGTRLRPDLFGPGRDKEFFFVFDFCQNFEFFNQNPNLAEVGSNASLAQRLFASRVELIAELDGATCAGEGSVEIPASHRELRSAVAQILREEVELMNVDNFIVRPKRRYVEKYAAESAWAIIGVEERSELIQEVAGLPSARADDDVAAKQFDLLILRTQLAVLCSDPTFNGLRTKLAQIVSLLEEMANVPMVAREMALIVEMQTDEYWQDITAPMLETARKRLRSLVKLIELKQRPIIYTDFEDEIGLSAQITIPGVSVGTDMDRFRAKARHFLAENSNHIAILKLRQNEPLTATDLAELERIFVAAGAAPEQIDRIRAEGGVGLFVRSLVGMDREAAKAAFASFLLNKAATANQIEFVNMIIDHLTERGSMDPRLLYESPFTDIDPMGVEGIFGQRETVEVVAILADIQRRAAA